MVGRKAPELETDIETKVVANAVRLGVFSIKLFCPNDTGWPDRVFILPNGKTLWIEFKRPGEEPKPKQKLKEAILKSRDHDHQIHDNIEEATAAIKHALDAARLSKESA